MHNLTSGHREKRIKRKLHNIFMQYELLYLSHCLYIYLDVWSGYPTIVGQKLNIYVSEFDWHILLMTVTSKTSCDVFMIYQYYERNHILRSRHLVVPC